VTIDVCRACGYPTVGPDLCAYCRPVVALTRGDQTHLSRYEPRLSQFAGDVLAARATIDDFDIVLTPSKAVGPTRRSERP
jgi:hypothetical protein